jgi:hypothetical protein
MVAHDPIADPLLAAIAALSPQYVEGLNGIFEDSLLLVGRVLGDRPTATAAVPTRLDVRGLGLDEVFDQRFGSGRDHPR